MYRSAVGTLLLVVALLGAGCSGSPVPGSTPTEPAEVTPAPVPAEATPAGDGLAPGLGPEGVRDAQRLVDAHGAALSNTSYTGRLATTRRPPDGAAPTRYDRQVQVAADGRFYYTLTAEEGDEERRIERFRADGPTFEATTADGTTTYRALEAAETPTLLSRPALHRLLRPLPSRVVDTTTRNGTVVHRVIGGPRDLPPLSNVTYTAEITENGLFRSFRVSYAAPGEGGDVAVTVVLRFAAVGETTVQRPPWYGEAVSATDDG